MSIARRWREPWVCTGAASREAPERVVLQLGGQKSMEMDKDSIVSFHPYAGRACSAVVEGGEEGDVGFILAQSGEGMHARSGEAGWRQTRRGSAPAAILPTEYALLLHRCLCSNGLI